MAEQARQWAERPLISVILPVYNPEESWLRAALDSVRSQAYDRWELCVADDASFRPHVARLLHRYQAEDPRVKVAFRTENGGIAAASNTALELATGDYVALLDHDDVMRPHALFRAAEYIHSHPDADIVYSDEDKILVNGKRGQVFFKPDWSPDGLLAQNWSWRSGPSGGDTTGARTTTSCSAPRSALATSATSPMSSTHGGRCPARLP
jgi:glycosyltransferase involved in cell wall biosynthesis